MLQHLSIENYALIRSLEMDFAGGFSVITGETGAGKSILLGALGLILGQRADTQALLDKNRKCIVEGTFNVGGLGLEDFFGSNDLDFDETALLRREITPAGKSRAFINDTPVNLSMMKELGDKLVDVHSQQRVRTLNDSDLQLAVIDSFAGLLPQLANYRDDYNEYMKASKKLAELLENEKQSKADQDYYTFLANELEEARFSDGEQEEVQDRLELLSHAEDIKSKLYQAAQAISLQDDNLLSRMSEVQSLLGSLAPFRADFYALNERFKAQYIELKDIASEIEALEAGINYDPAEIERLNQRIDEIYRLQKKHRVNTIAELLELMESFRIRLAQITSLEEQILRIRNDLEQVTERIRQQAAVLAHNRAEVIPMIEEELMNILHQLGMPEARLKIENQLLDNFNEDGINEVTFMFNANRGGELQEMSKVASGGEYSRILLSIKSLISSRNLLPTLFFDEIDIGVSGEVAGKVGRIMLKMSEHMQVIAITHLPQIAGMGKCHYLVYKTHSEDQTSSQIRKLSDEERISELAAMVSGGELFPAAIETARELLNHRS